MGDMTDTPSPWGELVISGDQIGRWVIGPFSLMLAHRTQEWRLCTATADDPFKEAAARELVRLDEAGLTAAKWQSYALQADQAHVDLRPALADRPLVIRPETKIFLVSGESVTLYMTTPLWVRVIALGKRERLLMDVPLFRPSDTWFGSRTEGELCYASRTHASLYLEDVRMFVQRAVTGLVIHNRSTQTLEFDRIKLPVPHLSLFRGVQNDTLWTNEVSVTLNAESESSEIHFGSAPPAAAGVHSLVQAPRSVPDHRTLLRAFRSFFDKVD